MAMINRGTVHCTLLGVLLTSLSHGRVIAQDVRHLTTFCTTRHGYELLPV